MFEIFLKAVVTAILKKALQSMGLPHLGSVLGVLTIFDSLTSISDCTDLGVSGVEVGYHFLTQSAANYLISEVVEDKYAIKRTSSGLYIAGSKITPKPVYLGSGREYSTLFIPTKYIPIEWIPTRRI